MTIDIPYYEDKTRVNNTAIGWFLKKGPTYFHKMLTEDVSETKNSTLERGTMIHEYILQPEEFQKDYVIWSKRRPSSAQQEKFCQALVNSTEIEPNKAIIQAYSDAYSVSNKSQEKILSEGLKIAEELTDYITFIKSGDTRKMITPYDAKLLDKIKGNIRSHKGACKLIKPTGKYENIEIFHEFHINWSFYDVPCKSLLDSIEFDYENKVCKIVDLKTTSKLYEFDKSINEYDYLRQLCFYYMAATHYINNEILKKPDENIKEWNFEFYFVCIDTANNNEIRVFQIPVIDVSLKAPIIMNVLRAIKWHIDNNLWEHTRNYYDSKDGIEYLDL